MMAKDLKKYLNCEKIKNIIINDFTKEIDINIIDLDIKFICDNVAIMQSNYIDKYLGILSNSFNKFKVLFEIKIDKKGEEEYLYIKPLFSFTDKKGIEYKIDVFTKEDLLLYFYYKIEDNLIIPIPKTVNNGFVRFSFEFDNGEVKKYLYTPTLDLLTIRAICRKTYNCKHFNIEVYNDGVWETIILDKENLNNCIYSLQKNSKSKVEYIK